MFNAKQHCAAFSSVSLLHWAALANSERLVWAYAGSLWTIVDISPKVEIVKTANKTLRPLPFLLLVILRMLHFPKCYGC
ncbi:hypothetical protein N8E89_07910 [Phyllobacterium sp. A18/5-2]|uniref:hypothetical protein n=1 Tax=Phyllobacterium sp. A18/5-2 TaxID=2978392 RepID=UPI0013AF1AC0|nr:hypothetical protein [Phyllobacterium sp. A18/5-2]UXN65533.1 hypothetical protein N8E89_07910 [Phyllobacterium sp. A18/5-2]